MILGLFVFDLGFLLIYFELFQLEILIMVVLEFVLGILVFRGGYVL